jgi:hypothetical protein
MEVRVANKSYASLEVEGVAETKKDFLKRVKIELEKDFDEAIDIVEFKTEKYLGYDDEMLTEAFKASKGLQEEIIKGILNSRGIEVAKIERVSKAKVQPRTKEEMQASEEYLTAKSNVGKLAKYSPKDSEEIVKGVVKSISLNKTNTIIYYNIAQGTKLRCATSKNETLEFFEI